MFLGQYEHNIDDKGRLTIPARFREQIGEDAFVTQGFDPCLMVLSAETFKNIYDSINAMSLTDPTTRLLRRLFFANASKVEFDRSGRILIPQFLRQVARLQDHAVVVGQGSFFEIWSSSNWLGQLEQISDTEANQRRFQALDISTRT